MCGLPTFLRDELYGMHAPILILLISAESRKIMICRTSEFSLQSSTSYSQLSSIFTWGGRTCSRGREAARAKTPSDPSLAPSPPSPPPLATLWTLPIRTASRLRTAVLLAARTALAAQPAGRVAAATGSPGKRRLPAGITKRERKPSVQRMA